MLSPQRALALISALLVLLAAACDGSSRAATVEVATVAPTSTPAATSTPVATSTAVPPTATATSAAPAAPLSLSPSEIPQGGVSVVVLSVPATAATAAFQGRQYPMLRDGERWWAIVGVGAFTQPGLYPVSVSYTPPGRTTAVGIVVSLSVVRHEFPVVEIELDSQTASLLAPEIVQAEIAQRAAIFAGFTTQKLWSGPFVAPGRGPLTDVYGSGRSYNRGLVTDYHKGTDFDGQTGDPVVAAAPGRVAFAGPLRVRGNTVILDHGAGVFTSYNHLSEIQVSEGQTVGAGQRIASLGATGLATGPHLHWEVIVRGTEVDGQIWLKGTAIGP